MRILLNALLIIFLIGSLTTGVVFFATRSAPQSSTQLATATTGMTLNFHTNTVKSPPGCNLSNATTINNLSLEVVSPASSPLSIGSLVCINVVLRNLGTEPFPVYHYIMVANVTNSTGQVVYNIDWGITPPSDLNYSLGRGQIWEEGVYWNMTNALAPISPGNYHVVAAIVSEGSSANAVIVETTTDLSLTSVGN